MAAEGRPCHRSPAWPGGRQRGESWSPLESPVPWLETQGLTGRCPQQKLPATGDLLTPLGVPCQLFALLSASFSMLWGFPHVSELRSSSQVHYHPV